MSKRKATAVDPVWVQDEPETKSLYQRIQDGEFNSKLEYPDYPRKPTSPDIKVTDSVETILELKTKFDVGMLGYDAQYNTYKDKLQAYRDDSNRLTELFQSALAEDSGVVGNPKASLLYSKAYDMGHGGGFSEIYNYYIDLVELIE